MTTQPTMIPKIQSATLVPSDTVQFRTSASIDQVVTITNPNSPATVDITLNSVGG